MVVITVGLFLLMPSAASALVVVLAMAGLRIDAFLEEEYLLRTHGEPYAAYMASTGRWLPQVFVRRDI